MIFSLVIERAFLTLLRLGIRLGARKIHTDVQLSEPILVLTHHVLEENQEPLGGERTYDYPVAEFDGELRLARMPGLVSAEEQRHLFP